MSGNSAEKPVQALTCRIGLGNWRGGLQQVGAALIQQGATDARSLARAVCSKLDGVREAVRLMLQGGMVTYSNDAKMNFLKVEATLIESTPSAKSDRQAKWHVAQALS